MGISMMELSALHGVGTLARTLSHRGALGDPSAMCRGTRSPAGTEPLPF